MGPDPHPSSNSLIGSIVPSPDTSETRTGISPEDVDDYEAAQNAGVPYEFHRYDGAGHAFQSFNGEERYRHDTSEDAWEKVLDFMGQNLPA